jgi:hypothetical protein
MAFSVPVVIVTSVLSIVGLGCLIQDCIHKHDKGTQVTSTRLTETKVNEVREFVYDRVWRSADRRRISEALGSARNPGSIADARSTDTSLHSSNRVSVYEPSLWGSEYWNVADECRA